MRTVKHTHQTQQLQTALFTVLGSFFTSLYLIITASTETLGKTPSSPSMLDSESLSSKVPRFEDKQNSGMTKSTMLWAFVLHGLPRAHPRETVGDCTTELFFSQDQESATGSLRSENAC